MADLTDEVSRAAANPRNHVGRYVLLGELGRGGMGAVYRAWDPQLQRPVALKVLLDAGGASTTERFLREASSAARLQDPGIVRVLDAGTHAGKPFLVMELVEGESFAAMLHGEPELREAVRIVREVALAVASAHAAGVIHRDIKPANVLVDRAGRARLTDFGLVRIVGAKSLTMTGQVLGTPGYMAPEQAAGEKERHGPASDVYSLGAMLYRVITGKTPFQDLGVAQVLFSSPPHPRSLNPAADPKLSALALACLATDPEKRPTAPQLAQDLGSFLGGKSAPGGRRAPLAFVAIAAVLAVGAGLGVIAVSSRTPVPAAAAPVAPAKPVTPATPPPSVVDPGHPLEREKTFGIGARGRLGDPDALSAGQRPTFLAVDSKGHRLFAGISSENRVLVYQLSASNALDRLDPIAVIGQPDFERTEPGAPTVGLNGIGGVAHDDTRKLLYAADIHYNRVLVFSTEELPETGAPPRYVLGQKTRDPSRLTIDFTVTDFWYDEFGTKEPQGVAFGDDSVFVASSDLHRVLEFSRTEIDMRMEGRELARPVSIVGRQSGVKEPLPPSAGTFRGPTQLAAGGDWVFVSDWDNRRVLGFRRPLHTYADATVVLGQEGFESVENPGPPTSRNLSHASGLALDEARRTLYVVDVERFRVLGFDTKKLEQGGTGEASFVLGQADMVSAVEKAGIDGLSHPNAVAVDPESGRLFVSNGETGAITTFRRR